MRINFRQGIISKQSGFLQLNGSGNIDLVASNRPVTLTIAHKDTDYQFNEPVTVTDAWKGVFDANTTYWLYWDFNLLTLERTFGSTTLQPLTQSSEPTSGTDSDGQAILQPGRMWFDTVNFVNYMYQGTSFKPVLRVFAGIVTGGNTISTASINTDFTGTQIGVTTSTFAGRPIFDVSGNPVQKSDGTFFTTESSFFSSGTRIDTIRLESNSVRAQSTESNIAKFTAVAWTGSGQIKSAKYNDTGNTVVGILLEDTALDQVGTVLVQGAVTNPNWNWTNIGQKLWIDNNGTLTDTDPHTSDVSANPQKKVPVARILSSDTIIFEQGLGGVGPTGPAGSIENLPAATTSDIGAVRLTSPPSNTQTPLAVSDTDSRLTDARPPTSHTHSASDITSTPTGNVSANDIQDAISELDAEKVAKTGDTMSGLLTLSADPTSNLHATTKRYVDGLVSGLVWKNPISVLNMIADNLTSPPLSPVEGDSYLMPSGTTGTWSSYAENDVVSWDGSSWINRGQITNLTNQPRIGIAFDTTTTPSGSFNGRKNQIAVYDQTGTIQTFITPTKNDAVFVRSASDQFAFFQYAYDGASWIQFGGLQVAESLDDVGDVNVPSPTDGQALIYDSANNEWISGSAGAQFIDQLNDVTITEDVYYDVANASFVSSYDAVAQDGTIQSVNFKTDGMKMYLLGFNNNLIFQYTLSTPFDITTASYDNISFNVSSENSLPRDIFFKPDGTQFYLVGNSPGTALFSYTLSSAWDLSTASFSQNIGVNDNGEGNLRSVSFKPDGTKLYTVGLDVTRIAQYTLSTPWDITTASYDGKESPILGFGLRDIAFNDAGDSFYVMETDIRRWDLSTAWDVSTASQFGIVTDPSATANASTNITFANVGTDMYLTEFSGSNIYRFSIGTQGLTNGQALVYDSANSEWIPGANGAQTLDQLNDVNASSPTDGQALVYDSANSEWISGAGGAQTLDQLNDVTTTTLSAGQFLITENEAPTVSETWSIDPAGTVRALAVDSNLNTYAYASDTDNSIFKINSNGNLITTGWPFIGHSGTVNSITTDSNNNIYSASTDNTVRKIDPSGNQVWSFTGHTDDVEGIASDQSGFIYTASSDQTVRKVDINGNQVWSFTGHTDSVRAVTVDSSGNVYSASWDNTVRKLDSSGTQIWQVTLSAAAINVGVDSNGNVYAGDPGNNSIRKFDSSGNEITSNNWPFTGHTDVVAVITVGTDDTVYSGSWDNTIRAIDPQTGTEMWNFTGHNQDVNTLDTDSSGFVYSGGDNTVYKLEQIPGDIFWANSNVIFNDINDVNTSPTQDNLLRYSGSQWVEADVKIDANGALYGTNLKQETVTGTSYTVTAADSGKLLRFTSSSTITVTVPEQITESLPEGFTVAFRQSGAGQIIIATQGSDVLNNIDGHNGSEGQHALISVVLEVAGSPNEWMLDGRTASVTAPLTTFAYSGSYDQTVRKIDSDGNQTWSFTGHTGIVNSVAADNNGYAYSGSNDTTVRKIDSNGNQVWSFTGNTNNVYSVAVDSGGYVYSASYDNNAVRKIDSAGNLVWTFTGHTRQPVAIAVDESGYVYSGAYDYTVRKINPSGTQVWSFTGHTNYVYGIAVDSSGYVYSGSRDNTVRKINSSGTQVWSFTGHTTNVTAVAVDSGGYVYSGSDDDTVRKINSSGTQVWSFTGHADAVKGVAVDSSGYVYSGSFDEDVIKIDPSGTQVWTFSGHASAPYGFVYTVAVGAE